MKKITSILLLVAVFATMFSMTTFAAANENVFTVTTDKTSVAAGEAVYVTIQLDGDFTDVALVQYSIVFDADKFSTVTSGRAPWGFDATWYNSTKDGNPENLGYINTPSFGANPANQANVMFLSTDGYYIDDAGALYGTDNSTVAGKIKFTAKADVDVIDASCFTLTNALVSKESGAAHTVTVNQIEVEEEEFVPTTETLPAVESSASELEVAKVTVPSLTDTYTNIGIYTATIPAAAKSEAGFIWVNDKSDVTDNKYTFDASVLNGGGEFTYTVLLYGIPADTTITAIPYYVTAAE